MGANTKHGAIIGDSRIFCTHFAGYITPIQWGYSGGILIILVRKSPFLSMEIRPHQHLLYMWFTRPGKHTKNDGTSPVLIGKSTISMAMFKFANC